MTRKEDDMTYAQALEYMSEMASLGSVLGLDNIRELMERLGNVQDKLKIVHVSGTNGKGSVCAFILSMLMKAGYRVGRFTSPAVFSPLEIIKIGNKNITRKAYAACLSKVRSAADAMDVHPTPFEMETALAFLYFYEEGCDICVIECGLGGADDATNVIKAPELSVITSVSMDHRNVLGRTLSQIAAKKAGIIKPGADVVTFSQDEEVMEEVRRKAAAEGSRVIEVDPDSDIVIYSQTLDGTVFDAKIAGETLEDLSVKLLGTHQAENAALALAAVSELGKRGFEVQLSDMRKGLALAVNPGRFEVIRKNPVWVIDGAHNIDAAMRLKEALLQYFPGKKLIFIIGVFADKDYDGILNILAPMAAQIVTVHTPGSSRALPSYELAKAALSHNPNVSAAASIEEAIELAEIFATKKDVVAAFGSLSFLGLLKNIMKGTVGKK